VKGYFGHGAKRKITFLLYTELDEKSCSFSAPAFLFFPTLLAPVFPFQTIGRYPPLRPNMGQQRGKEKGRIGKFGFFPKDG
jgi:hypothetical protein